MKNSRVLLIWGIVSVTLILAGCAGAGAGGNGETGTTVPPPENLMGTFAMSDGTSAVMDLQIGGSASSSSLYAAATIQVTGNVRYQGADYVVGGLYDDVDGSLDLIAENSGTGNRFVFSGTYTDSNGFSGTVRLLDSGGNELATGSASATGVSDTDKSSVKIFVGSFGGDDWGSWNGTLTSDRFYGTYFSNKYSEGGSFSFTRSGSTVSVTDPNGLTASGTLNGAEDKISGSWDSVWQWEGTTYYEDGSWAGRLVDSSYDAPAVNNTMDKDYLANLLNQTWENMVQKVEYAFDVDDDGEFVDDLSDGDNTTTAVTGVSARYTYSAAGSAVTYYRYEFTGGGYTDSQTGITLSGGGGHLEVGGADTVYLALDVGLDATTGTSRADADATDGSTLTVAYDGSGTSTLQIDVTIDFATESLTGDWLFDGENYVDSMGYLFF